VKIDSASSTSQNQTFTVALRQIATASPVASRVAVEQAQATKPSLHTRFVSDRAKGRD